MKLLNPAGFGMVCATGAMAIGLVVTGCADRMDGVAQPNASDLAAYRTEAAASSAAATSSRRAAARAQAITSNCSRFHNTSGIGVTKYNEFITAFDAKAADLISKRDIAVQTLEDAANTVENGVAADRDALPEDLAAALTDYADSARALADETRRMTYNTPVGSLNTAGRRVNATREVVNNSCQGR
ncbi:hypothetical protein ACL02S_19280 [Nocardia sp. 004]|uniref:hypothetical protein n=1 Tax=Nocardia sp. 004 TaxID=3385978 RepID=UPI0039A2ADAE